MNNKLKSAVVFLVLACGLQVNAYAGLKKIGVAQTDRVLMDSDGNIVIKPVDYGCSQSITSLAGEWETATEGLGNAIDNAISDAIKSAEKGRLPFFESMGEIGALHRDLNYNRSVSEANVISAVLSLRAKKITDADEAEIEYRQYQNRNGWKKSSNLDDLVKAVFEYTEAPVSNDESGCAAAKDYFNSAEFSRRYDDRRHAFKRKMVGKIARLIYIIKNDIRVYDCTYDTYRDGGRGTIYCSQYLGRNRSRAIQEGRRDSKGNLYDETIEVNCGQRKEGEAVTFSQCYHPLWKREELPNYLKKYEKYSD